MATIAPITLGDVALWSHGLHASVLAVGSHVNATPQGSRNAWCHLAIWRHIYGAIGRFAHMGHMSTSSGRYRT